MDWIKRLQNSIDHIENHLLEDLSIEEVAETAFVSSFHYQRIFSLLTGITIGEYIRKRRLARAGQEIAGSDDKVIDIALKHGYDSPESFSKAFTRFHGISPAVARSPGSSLKSFSPLVLKITIEGGLTMDYRIENKQEFKVLVMSRMFTAESSSAEIPKFWNEFFGKGCDRVACGRFGICCPPEKVSRQFKYSIGSYLNETSVDPSDLPSGFEILDIPAGTWAVFPCVGPMPESIQNLWKRIYSEWLPTSGYEIVAGFDVEMYTRGDVDSADYKSEIWLPVKKK
ncbi:MAG TPA: AraC family transcriptional regulator [Candidatus Riflebacteria bacterium]|jgi:AraC family transcriptional regulator|nr:AraC family transcriptional regulator [Candidatus Riflebacteria bacterium]